MNIIRGLIVTIFLCASVTQASFIVKLSQALHDLPEATQNKITVGSIVVVGTIYGVNKISNYFSNSSKETLKKTQEKTTIITNHITEEINQISKNLETRNEKLDNIIDGAKTLEDNNNNLEITFENTLDNISSKFKKIGEKLENSDQFTIETNLPLPKNTFGNPEEFDAIKASMNESIDRFNTLNNELKEIFKNDKKQTI